MTLEFYPAALEVFRKIKDSEPELAEKIKLLLKDVLEHPDSGVGTPVQMSGRYSGVWARKISFKNTLYYVFNEEKVVVLSIKSSSFRFAVNTETMPDSGGLVIEAFSDEDYSSVLALMQANRGKIPNRKSVSSGITGRAMNCSGLYPTSCPIIPKPMRQKEE